jgi:dipeptidyl aminopeptidase/acylaminoacyl peptidase
MKLSLARVLLAALGTMFGLLRCSAETLRALRPDDFAAIRDVSEPALSPDGAWVAYTVRTTDLPKDKTYLNIWLASWDGAVNRPLTFGEHKQSHPRWSPDGRTIAFLSARDDDNDDDQLWLLPLAGGEAEKITSIKGGIDDFAWSPTGGEILLVTTDPDPNAADPKAEKKTTPPIVIDRFVFKHDKVGYLTNRHSHLQLLSLASRTVAPLTAGPQDDLFPVWSPDGREIAYFTKRAPDPDRTDLWSVVVRSAHEGNAERVVATAPENASFVDFDPPLAWSPDGQWLAYVQGGDPELIEYAPGSIMVVPAHGGAAARALAPGLDRDVSRLLWSADSQSLLTQLEDDGAEHLVRIALATGRVETLIDGRRRIKAFDLSQDGHIAAINTTAERPPEVFAFDATGLRPLSKQNDAFFAHVRVSRVEDTKFRSADGTEIHGFLVHPIDPPAGGRSPALLRPHGGPQTQYAAAFAFEKQLFAANGYLVILPNPRGSSGRGLAFAKAIYADWGHVDVQDDLAAVDDAIARGLADPARLGVGGWSYGGMSTNYLIASTSRFKAATSGASTSNILAGYGTDQYVRDYEHELGPPWKHFETWTRISYPFLHADRIKTPTLFLGGEKDFNVPLLNVEQMYEALQSLGVPTELVIYPGQYHGFATPSYILDRFQRYLAWYAKWLPKT